MKNLSVNLTSPEFDEQVRASRLFVTFWLLRILKSKQIFSVYYSGSWYHLTTPVRTKR